MNSSTFKVLIPLVLLAGGVFAVTYFSQYTTRDPDEQPELKASNARKPLDVFTSTRMWQPEWAPFEEEGLKVNLQDRIYPGYFEPGENIYTTSFWFASRNPKAVRIQLKFVSCETCSGGQVAAIPVEITKQIMQMSAITALPSGLVSGMPLAMAVPAAQMDPKRSALKWQHHLFSKPQAEVVYSIPAAPTGDPWAEQWGILDLQFKVKPGKAGGLNTMFVTNLEGSEETFDEKFGLGYVPAPPFEVDKTSIDVGELTDTSSVQQHEILVFSSTRKPEELQRDLSALVMMPPGTNGEPGPFVSLGKLKVLSGPELKDLEKKMSMQQKFPVRVQSAFRMPVLVNPKVGDATLDIGRVERMIALTQGSEMKQIRVFGTMRGPIYLLAAKDVGFGYYSYGEEQTVSVNIESERTGVEFSVVDSLTQPKFLKVSLQKQPDNGDRGAYKLKVTIPAKEHLGEIKDGVIVLEAKGKNPLRLRIPVTGRGR